MGTKLAHLLLAAALAVAPASLVLAAAPTLLSSTAAASTAYTKDEVDAAAKEAANYVTSQGYHSPVVAAAFELRIPGSYCFAVSQTSSTTTSYYAVLPNGDAYTFIVTTGGTADAPTYTASAVSPASATIATYDSLAAATSANASDTAFIALGNTAKGDGAHGYYEKTTSLAATDIVTTIGTNAYKLTSAEGAVTLAQLGYTSGSVSDTIDAFHSKDFHTLVFPEGEYQLTAEIWSKYDNRAYIGFNATLYTSSEITHDGKNSSHKGLWMVRGDVVWGEGGSYTKDDGSTAYSNGYHTVRNIEIAGLKIETRTGSSGYRYTVVLRNARNVRITGCNIVAAPNDPDCRGLPFEIYGNVDTASVTNSILNGWGSLEIRDLCNEVNNPPAHDIVDSDSPTGVRHVTVRGCVLKSCSFDEAIPIFAGNEQGLGSTDSEGNFTEYPILSNCLVEDVLIENCQIIATEPPTEKQRVVAITCGYQDSPVENIRIEHNEIDVFANNYLILFGYAKDCSFSNNNVTMRSTNSAPNLTPVIRASHSRTGPTSNVQIDGNTMTFPDTKATVARMVDSALGAGAVSFTGNDVAIAGKASRLIDSTAPHENNSFTVAEAKYIYDRAAEVSGNTYNITKLGGLYESYDTNAQANINIHDETATIGTLTGNLLQFNGSPNYNGHSLSFTNCVYDIGEATSTWHYVSYSSSAIADSLNLSFNNCYLPFFDSGSTATIPNGSKASLTITQAPLFVAESAESVDAQVDGSGTVNDFADILTNATASKNISLTHKTTADISAVGTLTPLSGQVVGGFDFTLPTGVPEAEIVLRPSSLAAHSKDVLAFYRHDGSAWQLVTYAEVFDGRFTLNLRQSGTYAVVNKNKGTVTPTVIPTSPTKSDREKNTIRRAMQGTDEYATASGVYTATETLKTTSLDTKAACPGAEFHDITFEPVGDNAVMMINFSGAGSDHLYYENCTFDNVVFWFDRAGTYVFNNCEFKNSTTSPISLVEGDVHVYVFNSNLHDNKPPLDDWNTNASSVRSWKYAAIGVRANGVSLHVCNTTISNFQTNPTVFVESGRSDLALYFEHSAIRHSGGCGISMNSPVKGRIDDNEFFEIGAMRGEGGYEASTNSTYAYTFPDGTKGLGKGVGGNAVFAATPIKCFGMRVRRNNVCKVMENGLEGHFWCIDDNKIDTTGYRWDEGFDTVSTEGIWGGSHFVRNNRLVRTHKHGIVVERRTYATLPVEVSGNSIDKAGWGLTEDVEGVRVGSGTDSCPEPINVHDNDIAGYARLTRIINKTTVNTVTFTNNVDRTVVAASMDDGGEEEPESPATAATPDTAVSPASALSPATPDTAATPATALTPDTAATPATADTPASAATPDSPATPASPGEPTSVDTPATPDTPEGFVPGWRWGITGWWWEVAPDVKATGWQWDGSAWYLLDHNGALVAGWSWDAGNWYYLSEEHDGSFGAMLVGWRLEPEGWYWLNVDPSIGPYGAMARSSWVLDRGTWYLAGPDGVLVTGWQWFDNAWFYLEPSGRLLTNTVTPDGYRVGVTGKCEF